MNGGRATAVFLPSRPAGAHADPTSPAESSYGGAQKFDAFLALNDGLSFVGPGRIYPVGLVRSEQR